MAQQDGAWHHLKVPPLSSQLPQIQPARQTLPWHEIWEFHTFKVISLASESRGRRRAYIQTLHLNEQRCPISRGLTTFFFLVLRQATGIKSQRYSLEQKISMWGLSCRIQMISLCEILFKPTKSNPWDPKVWCRVHVLWIPSDKLKLHKTWVLKGLRW